MSTTADVLRTALADRYRIGYDVSDDGETFLMLREPGQHRRHVVVTFNWLAELEAKVPR
jgi:hypothetical protein